MEKKWNARFLLEVPFSCVVTYKFCAEIVFHVIYLGWRVAIVGFDAFLLSQTLACGHNTNLCVVVSCAPFREIFKKFPSMYCTLSKWS